MKILLYGINYWPELAGIGKYSGELCEFFADQGHDVKVITAPPYYPEWQVREGYRAWSYFTEYNNGVQIKRTPLFVPQNITTIKRLFHLISFSISSFPTVISQVFWKPDIIIFVQPTLFASIGALILAKLSRAQAIMHIQDYEIDAMFGLGMMRQGKLTKLVKYIESWLMRQFDYISTISNSMMENAKLKGVSEEQLIYFPNWSDTDFVTPDVDGSLFKKQWGFGKNDRIILYSGNIGKKQGLELLLDAAECLTDEHLHFVIVGAGAHKDILKEIALEKKLNNVHFKPLQPWERVPEMLAMADIHLVIQKKGAADVVLPSKLTNILSAGGHAIVTAEKHTEMGIIADKFPGIYECVEPENVDLFVESLKQLLRKDLYEYNHVARNYAVTYLSKEIILSQFNNNMKTLYVK